MSILYRDAAGREMNVAGLGGMSDELVYGASTVRSATVTVTDHIEGWQTAECSIVFGEPMPDADYIVELQCISDGFSIINAKDKTKDGFTVVIGRNHSTATDKVVFEYTAVRPYIAQDVTELQGDVAQNTQDIAAINEMIPSEASASNKLAVRKVKTGEISSGTTGNNSIDVAGFAGVNVIEFTGSNYGSGVFIATCGWSGGGYITKLTGSTTVNVEIESVLSGVPTFTISTVYMATNQTVSYVIKTL